MFFFSFTLAAWFAKFAHKSIDQRREFTNEPYHVHPYRVAQAAKDYGLIEHYQIVAVLHDTVEDTWVSNWMLWILFGPRVARDVKALTTPEDVVQYPRRQLKYDDTVKRLMSPKVSDGVRIVKLLDRENNLQGFHKQYGHRRRDIGEIDMVYSEETLRLVKDLRMVDANIGTRVMEMCSTHMAKREAQYIEYLSNWSSLGITSAPTQTSNHKKRGGARSDNYHNTNASSDSLAVVTPGNPVYVPIYTSDSSDSSSSD